MSGRTLLAIMLALACCAPLAAGQNREAALDALQWFPEGAYGYLAFCDWAGLQKTIVFTDFGDVFSNSEFGLLIDSTPLPQSALEGLEWVCMARLLRLRLADEDEMGETRQIRSIVTISDGEVVEKKKERLGREEVLANSIRGDEGSMWVLAFDDTRAVVKDGLAAGWLSRTGEKIMGRPILSISAEKEGDEQGGYFAYPAVTNELLLADDIELIKSMVAAGMGRGSLFIYAPEFMDLSPFIPDLGQSWQVSMVRSRNRQTMELWKEHMEMEERVEDLQKQLDEGLQYEITSFEAGDTIVEKSICIFGSDEVASQSAEEIRQELLSKKNDFSKRSYSINIVVLSDDGEVVNKGRTKRLNRVLNRSSSLSGNKAGKTEVIVEDNVVTTVFVWGERELQTLRFLKNSGQSEDGGIVITTDEGEQARLEIKK